LKKNHDDLNRSNQLTYLWSRFCAGLRAIPGNFAKTVFATLYVVAALTLVYKVASPTDGILDRLLQPVLCIAVPICAAVIFVVCVTLSAIPRGAASVADAFRRVRMTNAAGEPPLLTERSQKDGKTVIEVFTQGIPTSQFQENIEPLESALNKRITRVEPGRGKQSVRLYLAPGDTELPEKVYLPSIPLKPSEILLGESLDGPVRHDFNKCAHLLTAGSTGSGKTTLVKSCVFQLLNKRDGNGKPLVDVYMIDLKGGLDYPPSWRNRDCAFATTSFDALAMLSQIVQELERREGNFAAVSDYKGTPCSSLDDYNRLCSEEPLRRIVLVVDEIAELTDTTGMDKPHKEESAAIVRNLSTIARLGRAFGVNLIISTQRPDAAVVPGQIKNNLDGRVCGKADNVLSQIILDCTDAASRIPKDSQGLFLNQDGTLFRGYLFDNSSEKEPTDREKETDTHEPD